MQPDLKTHEHSKLGSISTTNNQTDSNIYIEKNTRTTSPNNSARDTKYAEVRVPTIQEQKTMQVEHHN